MQFSCPYLWFSSKFGRRFVGRVPELVSGNLVKCVLVTSPLLLCFYFDNIYLAGFERLESILHVFSIFNLNMHARFKTIISF